MRRTLFALALAALAAPRPVPWRILGPGGGGAQFRPTISPHDPNTVLVACDMTGAYITHDAGRRWREFNLGGVAGAFAFDPSNPKVIWAGSSGLYRSEDSGSNWRLVFPDPASVTAERLAGDHAERSFITKDNFPGGGISAIRIDPGDSNRVFIGIRSRGALVFSSADGGKAWRQVAQVPGRDFRRLYLDPAGTLYAFTDAGAFRVDEEAVPLKTVRVTDAAAGLDPSTSRPVFYMTTAEGLLRSTDEGASWQPLHPAGKPIALTMLAAADRDARIVYAAVQRYAESPGVNHIGILKSEDAGNTWRWVLRADESSRANPPNKKSGWIGRSYGPGWAGDALGLGADAAGKICYATDYGSTYRTRDGGATWEQVYTDDHGDGSWSSRGLDVTTDYGVHFDPHDAAHLVISYTDIGLFHSLNGGRTWRHGIEGVPRPWINTCYWVVFDPDVKDRAWSVWANAHDLPRPKMFRGGNFERFQGGVCRTDDGIKTWKKSSEGMPANTVATHIVLDPNSPAGKRVLYVAGFGKGVYKSTDDGATWTLKNKGISGNLNAWRLTLVPGGALYLLVARGLENGREIDGAIYRSTDGAETWWMVPPPAGVNAPNDLVFDPKEPRRMYLSAWPQTINGLERHGGLFMTEDGGGAWRSIFDESAHVYAAAVDPDDPRRIWINTFDSAAWRTEDRGRSWRRLEGYDFKWGHRPVLDPHHKGMLYLTTFGSSVWYGPAGP